MKTKATNYFLWIGGKEHGPFDEEQVWKALNDGDIDASTMIRGEEENEWQPLSSVFDLRRPEAVKSATSTAATPKTEDEAPAAAKKALRPEARLALLRAASCYPILRQGINVTSIFTMIGTLVVLMGEINPRTPETFVMLVAIYVPTLIFIIVSQHLGLILVDMADALVARHASEKE